MAEVIKILKTNGISGLKNRNNEKPINNTITK